MCQKFALFLSHNCQYTIVRFPWLWCINFIELHITNTVELNIANFFVELRSIDEFSFVSISSRFLIAKTVFPRNNEMMFSLKPTCTLRPLVFLPEYDVHCFVDSRTHCSYHSMQLVEV